MLYPAELRGHGRERPQRGRWDGAARERFYRGMYLGKLEQKPVKVARMSTVEDDEQDLTRKQRREQARAKRKELEQAEAATAVRRTRLTQLGIVVAIVVVIIVAVVLATGGSSKKGIPKATEVPKVAGEVTALVGGIPQSGDTIGNPTAPVTLQYFGDLQCPICRDFTLGALPSLLQNYVRSGKLKIEYRSLETATKEPETFKTQQVAALAAGKQQKMWYFIELFYHEQGEENTEYVTESYLQKLAQQVPGLSLTTWSAARSSPELANAVTTDAQAANAAGFTGTPSFLIGKTGGAMKKLEYASLTDPASFNAAIESLLKA
jgi:protein-disulfide isomerase